MGRGWDSSRPPAPDEFHPDNTRLGLLSAAFTPVVVLVAALAGWALASAVDGDLLVDPSVPVRVISATGVLVVGMGAPVLAMTFARRAERAGDPRARRAWRAGWVAVAGVVVAAAAVGLLL